MRGADEEDEDDDVANYLFGPYYRHHIDDDEDEEDEEDDEDEDMRIQLGLHRPYCCPAHRKGACRSPRIVVQLTTYLYARPDSLAEITWTQFTIKATGQGEVALPYSKRVVPLSDVAICWQHRKTESYATARRKEA